jgi:hypothetical protein
MIYYSLMNLNLNEFGPVNKLENGYLFLTMVISSILFSKLYGDLFTLFEQINMQSMLREA